MKISKSFFEQDTLEVARKLLGCYLIHETSDGKVVGKIVETEAYLRDDPASHSFKGMTRRNSVMFGSAGRAYVYFIYGMYYCFNVVTNEKNVGEAVLIRALEPVEGIELMERRRGINNVRNLCNGPSKLVSAMGIGKEHNGVNLLSGKLQITSGKNTKNKDIIVSGRIGIKRGAKLMNRFYIRGSEFVSGGRPKSI